MADNLNNKFNAASTAGQTRTTLQQRLGEIIADVIGDARVKALFDAAGKHPEEYEGQPTGEMALKLGVISPQTKTALLVAQAAARIEDLAARAETFIAPNRPAPTQADVQACIAADDPVFKFVGSERDPAALKQAQATWMAAQLYFNAAVENTPALDAAYASGLKTAASVFYNQAVQMLAEEGHQAAADKIAALATHAKGAAVAGKTPDKILEALSSTQTAEISTRLQTLAAIIRIVPPAPPAGVKPALS